MDTRSEILAPTRQEGQGCPRSCFVAWQPLHTKSKQLARSSCKMGQDGAKEKKKKKELHHYHHGERLEPCLDQDKHEPISLKPESLYKAINLLFAISKGKTSFHPQKWLPQGAPREAFLWRIALSMVTLPRHLFVSLTPFL